MGRGVERFDKLRLLNLQHAFPLGNNRGRHCIADHLATLRALAAKDRRKSLSEVVQVLIEREAERLLKEKARVF